MFFLLFVYLSWGEFVADVLFFVMSENLVGWYFGWFDVIKSKDRVDGFFEGGAQDEGNLVYMTPSTPG